MLQRGGNDDTGGDDHGMNDDNGGDNRDDEGEQQVEEEMGEAWERVTKKRKSRMSDDELHTYFDSHADRLFNSLKTEYRLQNLFTVQDLLEALNRSLMVTVHPASPEDFLDYDKLMNYFYRPLAGIIK